MCYKINIPLKPKIKLQLDHCKAQYIETELVYRKTRCTLTKKGLLVIIIKNLASNKYR